MKKKLLNSMRLLLVAILLGVGANAWADDYVLSSSNFDSGKTVCTVNKIAFTFDQAHGGTGQTGYTDYIKFSKNKTFTLTLPANFSLTNINVKGYTNSNGKTDGELTSIGGMAQTGKTFPAKDDSNLATATQITDGYDFAISQTGGTIAFVTANTNQICVLITLTGTLEEATAPTINTHPTGGNYQKDATGKTLTVAATPSSGECAYQWYSCTDAEKTGASSLGSGNGAQTATYTIPTGTEGLFYYFCRVSDGGSNTTDTNVATVLILDRAPLSTWDFASIGYEDVKYNTTFWTEATANARYDHTFAKATIGSFEDNYGNDLMNGIKAYRKDGDAKAHLYIGHGIGIEGASNKPGVFYVPVTSGKYYKITYTTSTACEGIETVGYTILGADVIGGSATSNITTRFATATVTVCATAAEMSLSNAGEKANSSYLANIEELKTLNGEWSTSSNTFYQGDAAPSAPSFSVTASDASSITKDTHYTVTYSLKEGSTEGIVTFTSGGGISAISNSTVGTATIIATVASLDDSYLVVTSTYEYTVTVNAKTPAIELDKSSVTLKSTPGKRRSGTAVTATVNLTGVFLEDGTYTVTTGVSGLNISPTSFTVTDGEVDENFTLTYAPGDVEVAQANHDIEFSDGTNSVSLTVTYSSLIESTLVAVSEATTWDWQSGEFTSDSNVQLKDDGTTTPAKAHAYNVVAADLDGNVYDLNAYWPNSFPADKIAFYKSEWPVRYNSGSPYYQGVTIKIQTAVPGTIQVWYQNTASKPYYRYAAINGTKYGNGSKDATSWVETGEVAVNSGTITITGIEVGENDVESESYIHIMKIVFTPGPTNPTVDGETVTLTTSANMAGWRAFYDADNNYSVDENTKVYVAPNDKEGSTITLTTIDGIPAGVPVILKTSSSADSYKMTLTKAAADTYTYTGTNKLEWTTSAVSDVYRLGYNSTDGVGFYPYSGTPVSGAVILNISSAEARALKIAFDDETTGISSTLNEKGEMINDKFIYNLKGQRVAKPARGLYIVNGKKCVVK